MELGTQHVAPLKHHGQGVGFVYGKLAMAISGE